MASTNQSPEYQSAEKHYLLAQSDEERIRFLEEMIKHMPQHKSAEKLRANLRTRYKKFKNKLEIQKKSGKSSREIIKKSDMQVNIIGLTNSGKSLIIKALTNATPEIADYQFTTKEPLIGTLNYEGTQIQIIDQPAVESEYFDQGIANTTDLLILVITELEQINQIKGFLENAKGKQIIVFNKIDLLTTNEKRKLEATMKSKIKTPFILFSAKTKENIDQLKELIFQQFNIVRIYTKEPHKQPSQNAMILKPPKNTVIDAAKKLSNDLLKNLKETRITGPSSKFPNQKV
ncbi:MAG: 50S ribosome-binding GTPase, partial [Nanoarchaeota archaeon]|nr:50S ribosome-binding GTPase [Nanoarchaeota archaeon]